MGLALQHIIMFGDIGGKNSVNSKSHIPLYTGHSFH